MFNSSANATSLERLLSKITFALCFIGLLGCLYGLSLAVYKNYPFWTNGARAEGVVVNIQNNGQYAKYPIIQFSTAGGALSTFTSTEDDSSITRGQKIAVIYAKDNPSNAIVDRGLLTWMMTFFWFLGTLGCVSVINRLLSNKN